MILVLAPLVGFAAAGLAGFARRPLVEVHRPGWVNPWVVGALGAGFGVLAALRVASPVEAGVYGVAALGSAVLFATDMAAHEIPHRVMWPSLLGVVVAAAVAAGVLGEWRRFVAAVVCGLVMVVLYFAVAWFGKGQFGLGDVSLSLLLGVFLGWVSPGAALVGGFGAFLVHVPVVVVMLASRRAGRATELPFGPSMLVSAWVSVFAAPMVLRVLLRQ